jgi:hypothetical protein
LSHIKIEQITSLSEQSEPARKCNLFYDRTRRAALRACDWNFAGVNQVLNLLGDQATAAANPDDISKQDVIPQWSFLYAVPAKCLRVRRIYNPQHAIIPDPYRDRTISEDIGDSRFGRPADFRVLRSPVTLVDAIAAQIDNAYAEFTYDIVDESVFPDDFVDGFSLLLAMKLAIPLSADKELKAQINKEAIAFWDEAKRKNGGEGIEKGPSISYYERSRGV